MSQKNKMSIAVFASAKLNEVEFFTEYKEDIKKVFKSFDPAEFEIAIGKLKNKLLIALLEELGYSINVISQHPNSLSNSNRKIIKDSALNIFFIYDNSSIMMELLSFAQSLENKSTVPVHLSKKPDKQNATYLFNQPTGKFHHSESRWSAIAQMAFIWLSKHKISLTLFDSTIKADRKYWLKKSGKEIHFTDWTISNTFVEAYIKRLFNDKPVLKSTLKPDIVWISKENQQVILIEVKTVGTTTKHNIHQLEQYKKLVENIRQEGWKCELYYLMSYGFEDKTEKFEEWHHLEKEGIKFLLWEELFCKIKDSELAPYIHPELGQYTLMPEWLV